MITFFRGSWDAPFQNSSASIILTHDITCTFNHSSSPLLRCGFKKEAFLWEAFSTTISLFLFSDKIRICTILLKEKNMEKAEDGEMLDLINFNNSWIMFDCLFSYVQQSVLTRMCRFRGVAPFLWLGFTRIILTAIVNKGQFKSIKSQ